MAITFRGRASSLNKKVSEQNASGFQEKSDPGPRQGVGGKIPLGAAQASFNKRNPISPTKKKNFYGGSAYFQDGYGGDLAKPITQRSKSSPFKINATLVAGAGDINGKFVDAKSAVADGFAEASPGGFNSVIKPKTVGLGECPKGQVKNDKGVCAEVKNKDNVLKGKRKVPMEFVLKPKLKRQMHVLKAR